MYVAYIINICMRNLRLVTWFLSSRMFFLRTIEITKLVPKKNHKLNVDPKNLSLKIFNDNGNMQLNIVVIMLNIMLEVLTLSKSDM